MPGGSEGAPSTGQQVAQAIGALPAGLFAFGKRAVDPRNWPGIVADEAKNAWHAFEDIGELQKSLLPGGLSPSDTEWAKASREGRIVAKVLGDLGSVALIGGGIGGGLRTAGAVGRRLPTAGARTTRAALGTLDDLGRQAARGERLVDGVPIHQNIALARRELIRNSSPLTRLGQDIGRASAKFDDALAVPFLAPFRAVSGVTRGVLGLDPTRRALTHPFPSRAGVRGPTGRIVPKTASPAVRALYGPEATGSLSGRAIARLPILRKLEGSNLTAAVSRVDDKALFPRVLGPMARRSAVQQGIGGKVQGVVRGSRARLQGLRRTRAAIRGHDEAFQRFVVEEHLGHKLKPGETLSPDVEFDVAVSKGLHAELDRSMVPEVESRRVLEQLDIEAPDTVPRGIAQAGDAGFWVDENGNVRASMEHTNEIVRRSATEQMELRPVTADPSPDIDLSPATVPLFDEDGALTLTGMSRARVAHGELRRSVKAKATDMVASLQGQLDQLDDLVAPPTLVKSNEPGVRRNALVDEATGLPPGGEWDWWQQLDNTDRKKIRGAKNHIQTQRAVREGAAAMTPDVYAETMRSRFPDMADWSDSEIMSEWADWQLKILDAKRIASGKAGDLRRLSFDVDEVLALDPGERAALEATRFDAEAGAQILREQIEFEQDRALRQLPDVPEGEKAPWEMAEGEFEDYVLRLDEADDPLLNKVLGPRGTVPEVWEHWRTVARDAGLEVPDLPSSPAFGIPSDVIAPGDFTPAARRRIADAVGQIVETVSNEMEFGGSTPLRDIVDEVIDSDLSLRELARRVDGLTDNIVAHVETVRPHVNRFAARLVARRRRFAELQAQGMTPNEAARQAMVDALPPLEDVYDIRLPEGKTIDEFVERMAQVRNRTLPDDELARFDRASAGLHELNQIEEQGIIGREISPGVRERPLGSREKAGIQQVGSGQQRPLISEQALERARRQGETTQPMMPGVKADDLPAARQALAEARSAIEAENPPIPGDIQRIEIVGADGRPKILEVDTSLPTVTHWTALRGDTPASSRSMVSIGRQGKAYWLDLAEQAGTHTEAGRILAGIAEQFPDDLARLTQMEIEPHYVRGGKLTKPGLTREAFGDTPGGRVTTGAEQARLSSSLDLTVAGQVQLNARDMVRRGHNEVIQQTLERYGRGTGELIEELLRADPNLTLTADDFLDAEKLWIPEKVQKFFEDNGFSFSDTEQMEWDIDLQGNKRMVPKRAKDPTDAIRNDQVTWLPDEIIAANERWYNSLNESSLIRSLDKGQFKWKKWILALSPRWHVNNYVGNVLQATIAGGVNVADLPWLHRTVKQMMDAGTLPGELIGTSLVDEIGQEAIDIEQGMRFTARDIEWNPDLMPTVMRRELGQSVVDPSTARTRVGGQVDRLAQASFRLNEQVDQMFKGIVYLDQIGKGVDAADALDHALRSIGNFENLTPFERRTIRRVFPFYTWLKHISQSALRLPAEHPSRVAAMFAVAGLYGPEGDELTQYGSFPMFGNIPGPFPGSGLPILGSLLPREGEVFNAAALDPFGSAAAVLGELNTTDPLSAAWKTTLASTSPFIKMGAGVFGANITQGGNFYPDRDVSIRDRFRRLGTQAVNMTPQTRYLFNTLRTTNDPLPVLSNLYEAAGGRRNQDVTFDQFGRPRSEQRRSLVTGLPVDVPVEDINRMRRGRSDLLGYLGVPRPFANAAS